MTKKAKTKKRLSSTERRERILDAAVPLFSQQGFQGVTTKELARQAGVSEALLYQHFPSKEHLYREVQAFYCRPADDLRLVVQELAPNTASLVQILFFLAKVVVEKIPLGIASQAVVPRLMMFSLLDDGAFARLFLSGSMQTLVDKMGQCFAGARAAGELPADGLQDDTRFWLCHNLLAAVGMHRLPEQPILPYPESAPILIKQIVVYMLRGIGLSEAAINRHFDHDKLTATANSWLASTGKGQQ